MQPHNDKYCSQFWPVALVYIAAGCVIVHGVFMQTHTHPDEVCGCNSCTAWATSLTVNIDTCALLSVFQGKVHTLVNVL